MKKVLLINPNTETAPYPVPPIGLCLLAAALVRRFDVRIYDATFEGNRRLRETLKAFLPDFLGIGVRNIDDVTLGQEHFYIDEIKRDFVDVIREQTDRPIILGGSGYSLFPRLLLSDLDADYGVVGEGERAFLALLETLEAGGDPRAIKGVVVRGEREETRVWPARSKGALDIPAATIDEFIDFEPYRARGTYPVQTKRGCRMRCVYCAYPVIEGRALRLRPPEAVVDEIAAAKARLGDVVFELVDSIFNAPSDHAEAICEEIVRRGLGVRLRAMGMNPGGVTDRLLTLMRSAGFVQIVCSADTASPVMLENMGKGFTREALEAVADLLRAHDMPTMWSIIVGGPGETEATVGETFDFISRFVQELDMVHLTEGIRVYPGTPIYGRAVQEGVIDGRTSLLRPVFYISPQLGKARLFEIVHEMCERHPNCVRSIDSSPSPALIEEAFALRKARGLKEPMFRTFLRIKRMRCSPSREGEPSAK
jgi:radical SAM superfamily enzyme YgiQ (UPF0313 family)